MPHPDKPLVLLTGAAGNLGLSLADAFDDDFRVVGLDMEGSGQPFEFIELDLTSPQSINLALERIAREHGRRIAAVIHLVAYFDFSGKPSPLYEDVNIEGTRNLVRALKDFTIERFIYASTMLVHAPCRPGERIDEDQPFGPRWEYPKSKKAAEDVIRAEAGDMPYAILRLAGVYDAESMVPTLAQQIARIYERELQSHLYSGSLLAGQSMLHRQDMIDAFRRTVERRSELPAQTEILIGEPHAIGYGALQDRIGCLIHGEEEWTTIRVAKPVAAAGAWAQEKLEPVVPDAIDQGETPFVKPFMVEMADDHYALDVRRAEQLLEWRPRHRLDDELPAMIANLKADPAAWYERNGVTPPPWLKAAEEADLDVEKLRAQAEEQTRRELGANRWAHFLNIGLAFWLITQPPLIGVTDPLLRWTEIGLGAALVVFAGLSLGWRFGWARWISAGIGALVMAAPFVFYTGNAAAYLSDTLVGALIFGFAIGTRPEVGPSIIARCRGPELPVGWSFNPSSWTQRIPIILLAVVGLLVSRYLAAYQLGHIDGVWEPFFAGDPSDPQNGTEEIITSSVSEAWPVPDAALGGYTYMLEILTGIVGSRMRWRTMPWLVLLFGLMIVPLGIVSITFIVIQPIVIGTWSTLAMIAAAAMLIQIPYSVDELVATSQFLTRRVKAGRSLLRVLLFGDTDEGERRSPSHEFERAPGAVFKDMWAGGVNLPWNLVLAAIIGASFLFTRLTLGAEDGIANADHLIGALILTVISVAAAEVARVFRYLLIPLALALLATPFLYEASLAHMLVNFIAGVLLAALSLRRGSVHEDYGRWNRLIV